MPTWWFDHFVGFPGFSAIGYPNSFNSGLSDVFLAAVKSDGSDFLYSTYLGWLRNDFGAAIALDSSANVWLVGQNFSSDFPRRGQSSPCEVRAMLSLPKVS